MTKEPPLAGALRPFFMKMVSDEQTIRDLEKSGFDLELFGLSCVKGDLEAIRQFSKHLTNDLAKSREVHNQDQEGYERIGFYVPPIFGYLAYRMLQKCQENSIPPPHELCEFLGIIFNIEGHGKSKKGKLWERDTAAFHLAQDPELNKAQLAEGLGIARSTLHRWLKEPDFKEKIETKKKEFQVYFKIKYVASE